MIWLLCISVVSASLCSVVMHKVRLGSAGEVYKFNLVGAAVWCLCLLAVGGVPSLEPGVIIWGAAYGVTQALFIFFKTRAMNSGPVSLTTLIGNFSMVISIFVCFILWDEAITVADIGGLALLLSGIALCTYKRSDDGMKRGWRIYSLIFLILSASIGILFKAFSRSGYTESAGDMMLWASVIMCLSYLTICIATGALRGNSEGRAKGGFLPWALASGLLSCTYNRLNVYLSGALDGVIFFSGFNGGVVLLSAALSIFLLRERPSKRQIGGLGVGICGIIIIGLL